MLTWTTKELADILGVKIGTIRGWVSKGKLKAVKVCNYEGLKISNRNLFEFFKANPKYGDIFNQKLTTSSYIGNKDSRSVMQYLLKAGLLK